MGGEVDGGRVLLLGRDHGEYGRYHLQAGPMDCTCVLTVGADKSSPSRRYKGDLSIPNEDALLVVADGDRLLMAVADAHFGHEASHDVLAALDAELEGVPDSPRGLAEVLSRIAASAPRGSYDSNSSFLVAVHDRGRHAGFGFSFADSTLAVVGPERDGDALHERDHGFVSMSRPASVAPDLGVEFDFRAASGELVLAFTDVIDGCHYTHPETSVSPRHLRELMVATGPGHEEFARGLIELALGGVDGHPGGQDNIALIVARA